MELGHRIARSDRVRQPRDEDRPVGSGPYRSRDRWPAGPPALARRSGRSAGGHRDHPGPCRCAARIGPVGLGQILGEIGPIPERAAAPSLPLRPVPICSPRNPLNRARSTADTWSTVAPAKPSPPEPTTAATATTGPRRSTTTPGLRPNASRTLCTFWLAPGCAPSEPAGARKPATTSPSTTPPPRLTRRRG